MKDLSIFNKFYLITEISTKIKEPIKDTHNLIIYENIKNYDTNEIKKLDLRNARLILLKSSKIFMIDKYLLEPLLKTNNIYNKERHILPFRNIFLNIKINEIEGILVSQWEDNSIVLDVRISGHIDGGFFKWKLGEKKLGKLQNTKGHKRIIEYISKNRKKIELLIINFLDFLNNPEVKIIEVSRTKEENIKRIKRGKPPLPTIAYIQITGKLEEYINKLNSEGYSKYSHRFWVRGHFRTLRDENRYKNKVGMRIWILPYVKGKGILIDKIRNVIKK